MIEKSWQECLSQGSARITTKDTLKATSLCKTAQARITFFQKQHIHNESANFIFEGLYTSIIELLHAVIISHGYQVHNHICIAYYIRDTLKEDELYRLFDDLRFKRNSLIYYGNYMDYQTAIHAIKNSKKMIKKLCILLQHNVF